MPQMKAVHVSANICRHAQKPCLSVLLAVKRMGARDISNHGLRHSILCVCLIARKGKAKAEQDICISAKNLFCILTRRPSGMILHGSQPPFTIHTFHTASV